MPQERVCVPINSPAWKYFVELGYVTLYIQGNWAILIRPKIS